MLEKVKPNFADNIWRPMNQSGLLGVSTRFIKQDPPWNCCCSGDLDFPRLKGSKGEVQKPSAFSLSLSPSKYFFILVFVSVYLSSYKSVTRLCPSLSLSFSSKNKFKIDLDFPPWEKQNKKTLIIQTQIQNKPWFPNKKKPCFPNKKTNKKPWFSKHKFKANLDSPRLGGDIQHLPHSARNCLSVAEVWVEFCFFIHRKSCGYYPESCSLSWILFFYSP